VVIDAGHGGHDPGAMGKKAKEKNIALAIALKLGSYIKKNFPDVKVVYTRKTDVFVELYKRAKIANQAKADLFISIHCNSNKSSKPYGTETWVMGLHKSKANLAVAQKENAAILLEKDYEKTYNNFNPNSPQSYIAFSLFQSAFRDQSIDFATKVESEFKNRAQRHDRGVKEAGFLVLWKTTMPAVLIETGFVSNPAEEKFLMSEQGQDYLASAIYRAFKAYKKEMEGDNYEEPVEKPAVKTTGKQDDKSGKKDVKNDSVKVAGNESKAGKKQVEKTKPEIVFGVQFATSKNKKPASSASFKNLENVWSYYHSGYYKYVSGRYANLNQAVDHLKIVRSKGFSDAFVVAFKGRERISPKEAMKIINANQGKN
jgi:N-acetylmuramoyl-L-alanine amidase